MPTYTACFRSDTQWACRDFKAARPQKALASARRFYKQRWRDLDFQPYDASFGAVDEIEVSNSAGDSVALWQSKDLLLREAAADLLNAAQLALRELREFHIDSDSQAILELKAAITKATESAP